MWLSHRSAVWPEAWYIDFEKGKKLLMCSTELYGGYANDKVNSILREALKETFKGWYLRCAENIRVEKGYGNLISSILNVLLYISSYPVLNLMTDILNIYTLKRCRVSYIGQQLNLKLPLNWTKVFLRLVVYCKLPSWGQTKQTHDFWVLPKESCVCLCVVIFNKATGFSTHNQIQIACSQPPQTECYNRVSFQLSYF